MKRNLKKYSIIIFVVIIGSLTVGCSSKIPEKEQLIKDITGVKAQTANLTEEKIDKVDDLKINSTEKNNNLVKYQTTTQWEDKAKKAIISGNIEITYEKNDDNWKFKSATVASSGSDLKKKPNFEISDEEIIAKLKNKINYEAGDNLRLINGEVNSTNIKAGSRFFEDDVKDIKITNKHFDEESGELLFDIDATAQKKDVKVQIKYDGKIEFLYPDWVILNEEKEQKVIYSYPDSMDFYFHDDKGYNDVNGICKISVKLNKDSNGNYSDGIVEINADSNSGKFNGSYKVKVDYNEKNNEINLSAQDWIEKSKDNFKMYDATIFVEIGLSPGGILLNANKEYMGNFSSR